VLLHVCLETEVLEKEGAILRSTCEKMLRERERIALARYSSLERINSAGLRFSSSLFPLAMSAFLLVQSSSPPPCIQSPRDSRQATTPTYAMQAEADAPLLNRKLRHCSVYSMFRRGTTKLPRELSRRGHSVPLWTTATNPVFKALPMDPRVASQEMHAMQ